ncbi:hypothetical protein RCG23_23930 [Neobacillus sp. PS3-34]|uniref:hypothetical protein n=1 Tax=Neobacillus sp. PS3-34 TaxID=3070678 RepID=UPI0027E1FE4D|nr:hypothetical protein [Neobacillus sp. PS3-34]WML48261.1 hypothetical protein RCG23_23930 [Neobacillus sp. PS3-34]
MASNSQFNNLSNESLQERVEQIWQNTCNSWQDMNTTNLEAFLSQCEDQNIDPQFCMDWVEQHKNMIPEWPALSQKALDWVNGHTSTGSPFSYND